MPENRAFTKRLISIYLIISVAIFQQGVDFQMMMFMYYPPAHICRPPSLSGVTISSDNCHYFVNQNNTVSDHQCQTWDFDRSKIYSTVVTELSLVCQYQYLQLLIIPLRQLSGIVNLLFAFLSDLRGRKMMFLLSVLLDSIIWILIGIIPTNYVSHIVLRCFKGAISAQTTIGFVLISELTPTKYRNLIAINYWGPFSLGLAVAPLYTWLTYSWRKAWLLSFLPNIVLIAAPFVLLESPHWLITNNRKEEGQAIAEKLNLVLPDEMSSIVPEDDESKKDVYCKELNSFFRSFTLITRLFVLLLTSFVFYFVYQALSTNISFASSNIYLNAIIIGLIEIPSGPLSSLSSHYFGPVFTTLLQTFLALICCVIYYVLWSYVAIASVTGYYSKLVLACIVRFMISGAWNVQGIFYVTIIPTTVRNSFNNVGEIFGKFGSAFGGLIGYYLLTNYLMSGIVYGAALFIAITLIGLVIPSTRDQPLPETVSDSKRIEKEFSCGTLFGI